MRKSLVATLVFLLLGCGSDEHSIPLQNSSESELAFADCSSGLGKLVAIDGATHEITPASPPLVGENFPLTTITFSIELCATTYALENWELRVGSLTEGSSGTTITQPDIISVVDTGLSGENPKTGRLVVKTLKHFTSGEWSAWVDTSSGKSKIPFTLRYKNGGNTLLGPTKFMQKDEGSIQAPPFLSAPKPDEQALYVEISSPSSLGAQDKDGASTGTSSVGGYLVMYWNEEECSGGGEWKFKTNAIYDGTQPETTCNYTVNNGAGTCSFGCGDKDGFVVPASIPSAEQTGLKNAKKVGCYKVARIPSSGEANIVLSGLKNGTKYNVTSFVLDASGNIGRYPSLCRDGTPKAVPMSSSEKDPTLSKSSSDCFVVTAASGDRYSPSVMYWRRIRDAHLYNSSFHKWYLKNGPKLAALVEENEWAKKPLNFLFETSGYLLVKADIYGNKMQDKLKSLVNLLEGFFFESAYAQESEALSEDEISGKNKPSQEPIIVTTPEPVATPEIISPTPTATPEVEYKSTHTETEGSASSQLQLTVSRMIMSNTEDKEIFNKYYPNYKIYHLMVGQTYRLFDLFGEFGLGGYFSYFGAQGEVPNTAEYDEDLRKKDLSIRTYGASLAADYRLRITSFPWVAPRVQVAYGYHYFREEASLTKAQRESVEQVKPMGVSRWKPMLNTRINLELSLTKLFPWDGTPMTKFGYGLEDFMLVLFYGTRKDYENRVLNFSGSEYGMGIALLFL